MKFNKSLDWLKESNEDDNLLEDDSLDIVDEELNEAQYVDSAEYYVPGFSLPWSLDWLINNTKNLYTATNDLKIHKKFKIFAKIALSGDWLEIAFICKDYKDFGFSGGFSNASLLIKQLISTKQFEQAVKAWDKNSKANGELQKYFTNASNYKINEYSDKIVYASIRVKKEDSSVIKDAHIKIDKKNFSSSDIDKYIKPAIKNTHKGPQYEVEEIDEMTKFLADNLKNGKLSKMIIKPDLQYFYVYKQNNIYDAEDMSVLMKDIK